MSHVKTSEGYDVKIPNMGQVTYNTVAGSAGLASFLGINAQNLLGGWGGGIFGNRSGNYGCPSPADMPVSRYELAMQQEIAAKDRLFAIKASQMRSESFRRTSITRWLLKLKDVAVQTARSWITSTVRLLRS